MQEDKQRVHDVYKKYENLINAFDGLFNANHSLLLTKYINTRNERVAQELSKQMLLLASVIFVACDNQQLKEIEYYYEHRFLTYLGFLAFKYSRDLNMRELDQLKKTSIHCLNNARVQLSRMDRNIEQQHDCEVGMEE